MLLAGRDGNYSAPPPEKSMLGILRGARGDFPAQAFLKELSSRLSGILSSNYGLVVSCACARVRLRGRGRVHVCACASSFGSCSMRSKTGEPEHEILHGRDKSFFQNVSLHRQKVIRRLRGVIFLRGVIIATTTFIFHWLQWANRRSNF